MDKESETVKYYQNSSKELKEVVETGVKSPIKFYSTDYSNAAYYFLSRGCSYPDTIKIFAMMPALQNMSEEELNNSITLLFNANSLYGFIYCNEDRYEEFVVNEITEINDKIKYHVGAFKVPSEDTKDYVMKIVFDALNREYIQKIVGIEENDTLQEKLKKLKKAEFNSTGYKVK